MSEPKLSAISAKMVEVMKAVDAVTKTGWNERQKYHYVKAADVANAVRNALITAGVAFSFDVLEERFWESPTQSGGRMFFCSLKVRGTFTDVATGESVGGCTVGWGSDTLDKAPYKAMTGALKYILRMNALIPDEEADPEKAGEHEEAGNAPQSTKTAPKPLQQPQTPRKAVSAPAKGNPKPFPDGGDVVEMTVKAVSVKQNAKGNAYGFLDADSEVWMNTFDKHVGETVRKGETYRFVTVQNGKYTNIVGFESDFELPAEQDERDQFAVTDDDIPF